MNDKDKVNIYFNGRASEYHHQYISQELSKYSQYPANWFRLQIVMSLLQKHNVKAVFDIGCGSCLPMIQMLKMSIKAQGMDFSRSMVNEGRQRLKENGFSEDLVHWGDLMVRSTLPEETFDAVTALGVIPYMEDEHLALENIRSLVRIGGRAIISFRNELFALYTFNRYSVDFFVDNFFRSDNLPEDLREKMLDFLKSRYDQDPPPDKEKEFGKISSTGFPSRFHNPLSIRELFERHSLRIDDFHFYHYHALPPIYEYEDKEQFWDLSSKMELRKDWRGYFMCSAFIVDAERLS